MPVKLRMRRMGSKKRPFYRIVAADSRYQRDGRFLDIIGYYDPKKEPFKLEVDKNKVIDWLNKGAQMSDTVGSLLRRDGIVQEYNAEKINKKKALKSEKKDKAKPAEEKTS